MSHNPAEASEGQIAGLQQMIPDALLVLVFPKGGPPAMLSQVVPQDAVRLLQGLIEQIMGTFEANSWQS